MINRGMTKLSLSILMILYNLYWKTKIVLTQIIVIFLKILHFIHVFIYVFIS